MGRRRRALGAGWRSNPRTASMPDRLPPCPRRVKGPRCGPPIGRGGGLPPRAGFNLPVVGVGARDRGDRSPGAVWSPASLESVGRWPLAIADTQIPGGSRPAVAAVRRRDRGVWTPHPRAVCRRPPLPERAPWRGPCVRTGPGGLSVGANGWSRAGSRYAGDPRRGRAAQPPLPDDATLWPPSRGGPGPRGAPVRTPDRWPPGRPQGLAIWLILPVVICLSQRLSHACLSISTLYGETANGSLNQLSFI